LAKKAVQYAVAKAGITDPKYLKMPASWLRERCWLEDPRPPRRVSRMLPEEAKRGSRGKTRRRQEPKEKEILRTAIGSATHPQFGGIELVSEPTTSGFVEFYRPFSNKVETVRRSSLKNITWFGRSAAGMPLSAPQSKSTTKPETSNPDGSQAALLNASTKASTGVAAGNYSIEPIAPPTTCATAKDRGQPSERTFVANHAETSALSRPMKAAGGATGNQEEEVQPPRVFTNDQTQSQVNAPMTNSGGESLPTPANAPTTNSGTERTPVNAPPINVENASSPTPKIEPDRMTQTDQETWEALLGSI
jgi:hypothetical protein